VKNSTPSARWVLVKTVPRDDMPASLWLREKDVGSAFKRDGRWYVCSGSSWHPREVLEFSDSPPWTAPA